MKDVFLIIKHQNGNYYLINIHQKIESEYVEVYYNIADKKFYSKTNDGYTEITTGLFYFEKRFSITHDALSSFFQSLDITQITTIYKITLNITGKTCIIYNGPIEYDIDAEINTLTQSIDEAQIEVIELQNQLKEMKQNLFTTFQTYINVLESIVNFIHMLYLNHISIDTITKFINILYNNTDNIIEKLNSILSTTDISCDQLKEILIPLLISNADNFKYLALYLISNAEDSNIIIKQLDIMRNELYNFSTFEVLLPLPENNIGILLILISNLERMCMEISNNITTNERIHLYNQCINDLIKVIANLKVYLVELQLLRGNIGGSIKKRSKKHSKKRSKKHSKRKTSKKHSKKTSNLKNLNR